MNRLLTDEEIEQLGNNYCQDPMNEFRLGRGHWEDIAPVIAEAQDAKTFKAVAEWLSSRMAMNEFGIMQTNIDWAEWQAFLRDEFPGERREPCET